MLNQLFLITVVQLTLRQLCICLCTCVCLDAIKKKKRCESPSSKRFVILEKIMVGSYFHLYFHKVWIDCRNAYVVIIICPNGWPKLKQPSFNFLTLEMDILARLVIIQLHISQSFHAIGSYVSIFGETRFLRRTAKAIKDLESRADKKRF